MFHYEKMANRDFAARSVKIIQRLTCGYRSRIEPMRRVVCDCKYGIAENTDEELNKLHGGSSEQNGCPELAMLEEVIMAIPQLDWERYVAIAGKKIGGDTTAEELEHKLYELRAGARKSPLVSTGEVADLLNVSVATVKRWHAQGLLEAVKGPGGHRKFTLSSVLALFNKREASKAKKASNDL